MNKRILKNNAVKLHDLFAASYAHETILKGKVVRTYKTKFVGTHYRYCEKHKLISFVSLDFTKVIRQMEYKLPFKGEWITFLRRSVYREN